MEPEEIVKQLAETQGNNQCFDCEKTPVEWVSVNNAVFLCVDCASKHGELAGISEVVPINGGFWTSDDVAMLQAGGNQSLKDFFSEYEFADNCKYITKAADYYRKLLKLKASTLRLEKPSASEGSELMHNYRISGAFNTVYKKTKRITHKIQKNVAKSPHYKKLEEKTSDLWEKTKVAMDPHISKIESQTTEMWGKTKVLMDPHISRIEKETSEIWTKTKVYIEQIKQSEQYQSLQGKVKDSLNKIMN